MNEFDLIEWIRNRAMTTDAVAVGIGDDAAVLHAGGDVLVAADTLLEGTHFERASATLREVGRKAMAVNLSDIAAMAGRPTAAVVALSLTRGLGADAARELADGIITLAESHGVAIVGGDVTTWDGPLAVTVTVLGHPTGRGPVRRSGARPGDAIVVTGALGGSLVSGSHYWIRPRIEEAIALHATAELHAMIDVSDGLAVDVGHIAAESGVGVALDASRIPLTEAARASRDPLAAALGDGEDFELVFTTPPADAERLFAAPPFDVPLTRIGEITADRELVLLDEEGGRRPLPNAGWRHEL